MSLQPKYLTEALKLRRNKGQWQAYESTGSCAVLAGPGSGKTKTLTLKMARVLAEDIRAPRGVACITFNNECVRELKRRLAALGVEEDTRVVISTVHSFCLQHIARPYAKVAGSRLPEPLRVALADERDTCWLSAIKAIKGPDEPPKPWVFRCDLYRRTHLDRDSATWYGDNEDAARIVERYEAALAEAGAIDFDGMVLMALRLVEHRQWVRRALVARFPMIVVDEYQDLGRALHRLVTALRRKAGARVLAVGDPDQSIYGFNGAEPSLLKALAEESDVQKVELKLNYRCGATIVMGSEAALGERRGFTSESDERGTIDMHQRTKGFEDQVDYACNSIIPQALKRREKRALGDIAILYRDKYEGDVIAKRVEKEQWEFIRNDQGNPYPRSPVVYWLQDCAAWCAGGWRRGQPRLSGLVHAWLTFNRSVRGEQARRELQRALVAFLHGSRSETTLLTDWLERFRAGGLAARLALEPTLRDDEVALEKLREVCGEDGRLAKVTVGAFGGQTGSPRHLNLMTLHSAKGLEFDVVVMVALEEGKMPSFRSDTEEKRAEDRRLFYVGMTRARHEVHLMYTGWYTNPYGRVFQKGPSRYVLEVQKALSKQSGGG